MKCRFDFFSEFDGKLIFGSSHCNTRFSILYLDDAMLGVSMVGARTISVDEIDDLGEQMCRSSIHDDLVLILPVLYHLTRRTKRKRNHGDRFLFSFFHAGQIMMPRFFIKIGMTFFACLHAFFGLSVFGLLFAWLGDFDTVALHVFGYLR